MKTAVLMIDACQNTPNYNYCLLNALAQKGENIVYATTEFAYEDITPPAGVKVRYCFFYLARIMSKVTSSRRVRRVFRGIEYPFNVLMLLIYILIRRIKVVHIMWIVFIKFDFWVIRIMQAMGCKVVFTSHNPFPHEEKPSSQKACSRIYYQVDQLIALSNFTKNEIVSRACVPAEKISVIVHGDFEYIFSQCCRNDALVEKVKRAAAGRKVIAFLGLIRPYKGLDYFIQAVPLIKKQMRHCFFLIAGSMLVGNKIELERKLTQTCEPSDFWKDIRFLPVADLKAYLSATDVLVQPYISASQSGNTVMAYSAGVPVVCTDVGGLAETVEDSRTGYVVPPEDPQAIADAVKRCFENDNHARMSENARRVAVEKYGWDAIAAQTIEVYYQFNKTVKKS